MHCDWNNNIFKFLNKQLQESLFLLPMVILIAHFCILKILVLYAGFPQNIIPYDTATWR
jgi:hypothetical protein